MQSTGTWIALGARPLPLTFIRVACDLPVCLFHPVPHCVERCCHLCLSAVLRVAGSLQKSTEVMKAMQSLVKIPEIQATMRELSKEMMKVTWGWPCVLFQSTRSQPAAEPGPVWTGADTSLWPGRHDFEDRSDGFFLFFVFYFFYYYF